MYNEKIITTFENGLIPDLTKLWMLQSGGTSSPVILPGVPAAIISSTQFRDVDGNAVTMANYADDDYQDLNDNFLSDGDVVLVVGYNGVDVTGEVMDKSISWIGISKDSEISRIQATGAGTIIFSALSEDTVTLFKNLKISRENATGAGNIILKLASITAYNKIILDNCMFGNTGHDGIDSVIKCSSTNTAWNIKNCKFIGDYDGDFGGDEYLFMFAGDCIMDNSICTAIFNTTVPGVGQVYFETADWAFANGGIGDDAIGYGVVENSVFQFINDDTWSTEFDLVTCISDDFTFRHCRFQFKNSNKTGTTHLVKCDGTVTFERCDFSILSGGTDYAIKIVDSDTVINLIDCEHLDLSMIDNTAGGTINYLTRTNVIEVNGATPSTPADIAGAVLVTPSQKIETQADGSIDSNLTRVNGAAQTATLDTIKAETADIKAVTNAISATRLEKATKTIVNKSTYNKSTGVMTTYEDDSVTPALAQTMTDDGDTETRTPS